MYNPNIIEKKARTCYAEIRAVTYSPD